MGQLRFKSIIHARIFVIVMSTLGVGIYFSPTLYRAFILPRKLEQRQKELDSGTSSSVRVTASISIKKKQFSVPFSDMFCLYLL